MNNETGCASNSDMNASSTSDPPICQHNGGVGVGGSVGSGVRVDQRVGDGSGGTVIDGVREGCWGGKVAAGRAAEHPASEKHNQIQKRSHFFLILPCIIRRKLPAGDRHALQKEALLVQGLDLSVGLLGGLRIKNPGQNRRHRPRSQIHLPGHSHQNHPRPGNPLRHHRR